MDKFEDAVAYVSQIEKKSLEHLPYRGNVDTSCFVDVSPADIENLSYHDLLNSYDRIRKVIKASSLEIFERPSAVISTTSQAAIRREEVETKVKELTSQAVEELEKELVTISEPKLPEPSETVSGAEATAEAEKARHEDGLLEFEDEFLGKHEPAAKEALPKQASILRDEHEPNLAPESAIEHETEPGLEPESKERISPAEEMPQELKRPTPQLAPAILKKQADEAADKKYQEIEEHFRRESGGSLDEDSVKRKMLDLTKQLFREKSSSAREHIKTEIAVLKNMLTQLGKVSTAKKVAKDYSSPLWETMSNSQVEELVSLKDALANSFNRRTAEIKKKFYDGLAALDDDDFDSKKKLYEKFVFDITHMMELVPAQIKERSAFLVQKHQKELARLDESVKDKKMLEKIRARTEAIQGGYLGELTALEETLKKGAENLMDKIGHEVLKPAPAAPSAAGINAPEVAEATEAADHSDRIIFEINETDEGTLLYYLHSKKPDTYKNYERKHLSKHEALFYAKVLMAKEKGLSDVEVRKYFGSLKGESA